MSRLNAMLKEGLVLLRFGIVGAGGFIVDAGILELMVHGLNADPFVGRAISAPIAIIFTFLLNRHWSFAASRRHRLVSAFLAYLVSQGVGLLCNIAVFAAAMLVQPSPLAALTLASASALIVNYFGARLLVFRA
jgi:putative flippase GtrA